MSGLIRRLWDALWRRDRRAQPLAPPPASSPPVPSTAEAAPIAPAPEAEPASDTDGSVVTVDMPVVEWPRPIATPSTKQSVGAVKAFVASVRHLPLFTGTATQLVRSAGREDVSGRELARLIATDASLVAHLLRIVNSPFFGLARKVATVDDALIVLGVDRVRRMVTAAVMQRPLMSYLHDTTVVRTFWRHELLCAALARHLALQRGLGGEVAYMAGLMHDVGRLAMLMEFPQHTDLLLRVGEDADRDDPRHATIEREYAQFGFDHAQVGGALLELWGLPDAMMEAASQHEHRIEPIDPMSACVWSANRLSHEAVFDPDGDDDTEAPWMTSIGLSVRAYRQIVAEIRALESDA